MKAGRRPGALHRPGRFAAMLAACGVVLAACTGAPSVSSGPPSTPPPSASPAGPTPGAPDVTPNPAPPSAPAGDGTTATVTTALGAFTIELYTDSAPVAAANFVQLARSGYYDGVVFHRIVPGFVIQGGDPTGTGRGGPGYTIPDEPVVGDYVRGVVAMARTPAPNSQGSQFFVCLDDLRRTLPRSGGYVIFGRVTAGMEVVEAIAAGRNSGPPNNLALDAVAMTSVTVTAP